MAIEPNFNSAYFCETYKQRMGFTFLNGWREHQRRVVFCNTGKLHEIQISVYK